MGLALIHAKFSGQRGPNTTSIKILVFFGLCTLVAPLAISVVLNDPTPTHALTQNVPLGFSLAPPLNPPHLNTGRHADLGAALWLNSSSSFQNGEVHLEQDGPHDVRALIGWINKAGDNAGKPYAIVDKRQARVMLFSGRGKLIATSPVLLGKAQGDDSAPGIGDKPLALIHDDEKTTPAGRFVSEPGLNTEGSDVIWVDYHAAVSMHRVRATDPAERRLERLASPSPADNRISFGCINVPAAFFDRHVKPMLGSARALVYVLPETRSIAAQFPDLAQRAGS